MTRSGEALPRRGEVWWVRVDKRRPAVIVQTDLLRDPRVRSFLVVPLSSRLHLEGLPGTVRLSSRETGLTRPCVANVLDVHKVLRSDLLERAGRIEGRRLAQLDDGLRLVLGL